MDLPPCCAAARGVAAMFALRWAGLVHFRRREEDRLLERSEKIIAHSEWQGFPFRLVSVRSGSPEN